MVDKSTGEIHPTFPLVTVETSSLMWQVHKIKRRMPLILPRANEDMWLDPKAGVSNISKLVTPYPATDMSAYTVFNDLHNPRIDANRPKALEVFVYDKAKDLLPEL